MNRAKAKYCRTRNAFPVPGTGRGSHSCLLTCANLARLAGMTDEEAAKDIFDFIPTDGPKQISLAEVETAVAKAYSTELPQRSQKTEKRSATTGKPDIEAFIRGFDISETELSEKSPFPLSGYYPEDSVRLIKCCYSPDELIFIGTHYDGLENILTRREWVNKLYGFATSKNALDLPFIIPNPLSGLAGRTKSGKVSYRCDACVSSFRFAVGEFDNLSRQHQLAFWNSAISKGFPVAVLIDSGGKSIHSWLGVNCKDRDEWEQQVEQRLFRNLLVPMGCDASCKNESRLSRFPGNYRDGKNAWQRLLYLNPEVVG